MNKPDQKGRLAMQKVFGTIEIFEAILLCLPLEEILVIEHVHSDFHKCITGSPTIQQALFFAPVPQDTRRAPKLNPILQALFPVFSSPKNQERRKSSRVAKDAFADPKSRLLSRFSAADSSRVKALPQLPADRQPPPRCRPRPRGREVLKSLKMLLGYRPRS